MNFNTGVDRKSCRALKHALAILLLMAGVTQPVHAASPVTGAAAAQRLAPQMIDDSATVVLDSAPIMNWRSITPKSRDNAIIGRTRVNVKLATAPWIGKSGKIYMVLPAETSGSVKVAWRTQGVLLDGQLAAGGRTLVFAGTIRERRLEDILEVQIEADGTRVRNSQQLRFHFEIDVE